MLAQFLFAYLFVGVNGFGGTRSPQDGSCDRCVEGFKAAGGCEDFDNNALIPAGCDACGYAAANACCTYATMDTYATMPCKTNGMNGNCMTSTTGGFFCQEASGPSCTEVSGYEFGDSSTSIVNKGINDVRMTLEDCKDACLEISECVGYTYANNACHGKYAGSLTAVGISNYKAGQCL